MIVCACHLGSRGGKITNLKQNLLECGCSKSYVSCTRHLSAQGDQFSCSEIVIVRFYSYV